MNRKAVPVLVALGLILIIIAGFFGTRIIERYILLVYALPDSIVYADHSTVGSTGKPLIWVDKDAVYLSAGLVANYTDIRVAAYDSALNKRIFINNTWDALNKAVVKNDSNIRVKGGVKSPIVTQ